MLGCFGRKKERGKTDLWLELRFSKAGTQSNFASGRGNESRTSEARLKGEGSRSELDEVSIQSFKDE